MKATVEKLSCAKSAWALAPALLLDHNISSSSAVMGAFRRDTSNTTKIMKAFFFPRVKTEHRCWTQIIGNTYAKELKWKTCSFEYLSIGDAWSVSKN
jgi:hypothetical protein